MAATIHKMAPVRVRLDNENIFTSEVTAGPHTLTTDEPEEAGGLDQGLSPYQMVSAALGSCTVMTLHIYARHKKWPLESVEVFLEHEKKHPEEVEEEALNKGKMDHFNIRIQLTGPLSDEQKKRLLDIAYKCPVHKTLTNPLKINVELAD